MGAEAMSPSSSALLRRSSKFRLWASWSIITQQAPMLTLFPTVMLFLAQRQGLLIPTLLPMTILAPSSAQMQPVCLRLILLIFRPLEKLKRSPMVISAPRFRTSFTQPRIRERGPSETPSAMNLRRLGIMENAASVLSGILKSDENMSEIRIIFLKIRN